MQSTETRPVVTSTEPAPAVKKTRAKRTVSANGGDIKRRVAAANGDNHLYLVAVSIRSKKVETHYFTKSQVTEFLADKEASKVSFANRMLGSEELLRLGQEAKADWMVLLISGGGVINPQPIISGWSL